MSRTALILVALGLAAMTVVAIGCGKKVVSRVDPNETIDLSGKWNDTDSRLVAEEMIADCLGSPWLVRFEQNARPPAVIAGSIRNKSAEHIPVTTFLRDIERALVNSGAVQVVASAEERGEIRDEREDQRANAAPETIKRMGMELGADFMLIGEITQINDREEGEEVRYYQVDLTLVNIETNVKTWIGQKKIKKYVARRRYGA
ncbi:MAG: penicillin-binding protein activator LpoB [Candidatus Eiseniibacteriota bacterium]|jgi:uncharacterized protein (TIGR02722 family)